MNSLHCAPLSRPCDARKTTTLAVSSTICFLMWSLPLRTPRSSSAILWALNWRLQYSRSTPRRPWRTPILRQCCRPCTSILWTRSRRRPTTCTRTSTISSTSCIPPWSSRKSKLFGSQRHLSVCRALTACFESATIVWGKFNNFFVCDFFSQINLKKTWIK